MRQILSLICHTCRLRSGGRRAGGLPSVAWLLTIVCPNAPQVVWIQLDDVTAPTRVGGSPSLTCKYRHRVSDTCGQCAGLYRYEKKRKSVRICLRRLWCDRSKRECTLRVSPPCRDLAHWQQKKKKEGKKKKPICETGGTRLKDNWERAR